MGIISTDFIGLTNIFIDQEQQFHLKINEERNHFLYSSQKFIKNKSTVYIYGAMLDRHR